MKEKELSCGFVVFDKKSHKILACHPTGGRFGDHCFDIPKGHIENGETPLECAKRELFEETGLTINGERVEIHGLKPYMRTKDLYLFSVEMDFDVEKLECSTYFVNREGKSIKEMNYFVLTDNTNLFYKSLQPLVDEVYNKYLEDKEIENV